MSRKAKIRKKFIMMYKEKKIQGHSSRPRVPSKFNTKLEIEATMMT